MKVITLYLPWAWWIRKGWKTVETRLHPKFNTLRGRIGIHAGKTLDAEAIEAAREYLTKAQIDETLEQDWNEFRSRIIATARVDAFGRCQVSDAAKALIECETLRYGLWLGDVAQTLSEPVRGFQGAWEYEGNLNQQNNG